MIINHSCYFCQKIKEAAVLQVLKFNKQSEHLDVFSTRHTTRTFLFYCYIGNSKCIANALGRSFCFLAQSRKLFFRLEKAHFYMQTIRNKKYYISFFFLSYIKRIHLLYIKGEIFLWSPKF